MVRSAIKPRPWTAEDEELLAGLLAEGKDLRAIAAQMSRTVAAVQRRATHWRGSSNGTGKLTFGDYLDGRRSTYTQEWEQLQQLKADPVFRKARSWEDIESHLISRNAPLGVRNVARTVWINYRQARSKRLGDVRQ